MPTIGIAGVGLIGGSVALRAVELGWPVSIFEPDARHRSIACERLGAVAVAASFAELAERSETLVLAAPLDATLAQIADLQRDFPTGLRVVLDTASVKTPVARAAVGLATFVGSHPLAGSERSGPLAARADLFAERLWSYDSAAAPGPSARARDFIAAMGARPVSIASDDHDRVVALTSHLPQVLSSVLAAHLASGAERDPRVVDFCGTGIRSMLRLAGSSWPLWNAVLRANAVPLAQEVRQLAAILSVVAESLEMAPESALPGGRPEAALERPDSVLEEIFERAGIVYERLNANAASAGGVTHER
jgi:prephenate dehydrogenase